MFPPVKHHNTPENTNLEGFWSMMTLHLTADTFNVQWYPTIGDSDKDAEPVTVMKMPYQLFCERTLAKGIAQ